MRLFNVIFSTQFNFTLFSEDRRVGIHHEITSLEMLKLRILEKNSNFRFLGCHIAFKFKLTLMGREKR